MTSAGHFYQQLGFQVGARNRHPWGTENRLIQFRTSFIELSAPTPKTSRRIRIDSSALAGLCMIICALVKGWRYGAFPRRPYRIQPAQDAYRRRPTNPCTRSRRWSGRRSWCPLCPICHQTVSLIGRHLEAKNYYRIGARRYRASRCSKVLFHGLSPWQSLRSSVPA